MDEYLEIMATITDKWSGVETIYAGSVPAWAWAEGAKEWRRTMRREILADRTFEPAGWRVTFAPATT